MKSHSLIRLECHFSRSVCQMGMKRKSIQLKCWLQKNIWLDRFVHAIGIFNSIANRSTRFTDYKNENNLIVCTRMCLCVCVCFRRFYKRIRNNNSNTVINYDAYYRSIPFYEQNIAFYQIYGSALFTSSTIKLCDVSFIANACNLIEKKLVLLICSLCNDFKSHNKLECILTTYEFDWTAT